MRDLFEEFIANESLSVRRKVRGQEAATHCVLPTVHILPVKREVHQSQQVSKCKAYASNEG